MADRIDFQLRGADDAIAAFKELGDFIRGDPARAAVRAGAKLLEGDICARAPEGTEPHDPHPGRLRESIEVRVRATAQEIRARVVIFKNAFYWRFVEFGHATRNGGHVAPQPFATSAILAGAEAAAQEVIDAFDAAVQRAERRAQRFDARLNSFGA